MKNFLKEIFTTLVISSVFLTSINFLKIIGFVLILIILGRIWGNILRHIIRTRYSFIIFVLGMYIVFTLLGLFSSILVVWYSLYSELIIIPFVCAIFTTYIIGYVWNKKRSDIFDFSIITIKKLKEQPLMMGLFIFFVVLSIFGIYIMASSQSSEILLSPWQAIPSVISIMFFILLLAFAVMIYYGKNIRLLLIACIVFSFFVHAYMPLSHVMPWGGDVWRHVAVEQKMIDGGFELHVLFGSESLWRETSFGLSLPEALVIPHKYAYGNFLGSTILVEDIFGYSLMTIHRWMVPIIWSVIMPLILFLLGRLLFSSSRRGLWLVWLSFIPFTLQAAGSISMPVSFGLPIFLITLLLWLYALKRKDKVIQRIVYFFTVLFIFGYTLYFLLMIFVIGLSFILRYVKNWYTKIGIAIVSMFFLPIVELITRVSKMGGVDIIHNIKQMIGSMSGMFYAIMIRPHDILTGNILFNHTPDFAFVSTIFTSMRWHVTVVVLTFWILFFVGIIYILLKQKNKLWTIVSIFLHMVVGGYIISWIFLSGDHLFVRRLDVLIGLGILLMVYFVWVHIISKYIRFKFISIIIIFVLSWFGTTAYMSGSDMRVVSVDEYTIAQSVFLDIQYPEQTCVLGDTWMLLALEGISSEKIKAGNFPMDYQFSQVERVRSYTGLLEGNVDVEKIFDISQKNMCVLVAPMKEIDIEEKTNIDEKLEVIGVSEYGFYRWLIKLQK